MQSALALGNGDVPSTALPLDRQTSKSIVLISLNPDHPDRDIAMRDVEWVARIVWASQ